MLFQNWKKSVELRGPSGARQPSRGRFPNRLASQCSSALSFVSRLLRHRKGNSNGCSRYSPAGIPAPSMPRAPMLFGALESYDRGDYIVAGCKLREAVKRFLIAACDWYDVKLHKSKFPVPLTMLAPFTRPKQLDDWGLEYVFEMINIGHKLAHCQAVDVRELRSGIAILFSLMDSEPYAVTSGRSRRRGCWWVVHWSHCFHEGVPPHTFPVGS